jgi:hypothetical protein
VNNKVEKEAEENQRRQRESNTKLEYQVKQNQEKVAQELHKLEQEVVGLKLDLCTQAEVQVSGTPTAVPPTSQDNVSQELTSRPQKQCKKKHPKEFKV